jgi:hypothetical protein
MVKVLADFHHQDLYYSLQLLFEKRLGWELYRPIGLEWYHEGYWAIYPHISTAQQYLALDQPNVIDINGKSLSEACLLNKNYRYEDGIYYVQDTSKDKIHRAITLEKFKNMKFDILLSSMPPHIRPFNKLIQLYQPQAKHIFQIGNPGWWTNEVKNVMCGTTARAYPPSTNLVQYHQEFDLSVFQYKSPTVIKKVNSYIHYMDQIQLFNNYKTQLTDWEFTNYGAGFPVCIHKTEELAKTMQESGFTWHIKPLGDGFGHTIHDTYACGRPAIINTNHYRNMVASALLEDGVTCIDIGKRPIWETITILQGLAKDPDAHMKLCEQVYRRFTEVVNFDAEEIKIRKFLEDLR